MIASVDAFSRARARVATADTAAVRIVVTARRVEHGDETSVVGVEQQHGALMRVELRCRDCRETR